MKNAIQCLVRNYGRTGIILGGALIFSTLSASNSIAAKKVICPQEVITGAMFPMKDSRHVKWHNSNSINFNIDYKTVCTWKDVTPSQRKEGHVCTYSTFSDCSIEGTPAGTKLYLTDYKPKINSSANK